MHADFSGKAHPALSKGGHRNRSAFLALAMDYIDSIEMYVFDLALQGLVHKARSAGRSLSSVELARRMLIVQRAHVEDPDAFARLVLADDFPELSRMSCAGGP